jgi:hypothetical protein
MVKINNNNNNKKSLSTTSKNNFSRTLPKTIEIYHQNTLGTGTL